MAQATVTGVVYVIKSAWASLSIGASRPVRLS
jgi:hypothetical protein